MKKNVLKNISIVVNKNYYVIINVLVMKDIKMNAYVLIKIAKM